VGCIAVLFSKGNRIAVALRCFQPSLKLLLVAAVFAALLGHVASTLAAAGAAVDSLALRVVLADTAKLDIEVDVELEESQEVDLDIDVNVENKQSAVDKGGVLAVSVSVVTVVRLGVVSAITLAFIARLLVVASGRGSKGSGGQGEDSGDRVLHSCGWECLKKGESVGLGLGFEGRSEVVIVVCGDDEKEVRYLVGETSILILESQSLEELMSCPLRLTPSFFPLSLSLSLSRSLSQDKLGK